MNRLVFSSFSASLYLVLQTVTMAVQTPDPWDSLLVPRAPYLHVNWKPLLLSTSCLRTTMFNLRFNVLVRSTVAKRPFSSTLLRANASFSIPTIDFAKIRNAASPAEKKETAKNIVAAFKESGFLYLYNHGIPPGMFIELLSHHVLTRHFVC